jgi:pimeloyl-ACP methyl ester carboxylesterase
MDGLQYIRRVSAHVLGPNVRFGLMGHSMGGGMSAMFAATHPDHVAALVLLDCVKPISRRMETIVDRTRSAVDEHMNFESKMAKAKPPVYTYEDAKKRLLDRKTLSQCLEKMLTTSLLVSDAIQIHGKHVISEQSADILLKRGLKESDCGSGFVYTRDIRHRLEHMFTCEAENASFRETSINSLPMHGPLICFASSNKILIICC